MSDLKTGVAQDPPPTASLKHVFAFFRWQHAGTLALAIFSACCIAGLHATLSVVLGRVFAVIVDFGRGRLDDHAALARVSLWAMILCVMGGLTWLANTVFLALWVIFSELQVKSVRDSIFSSLSAKEMSWFDSQEDGIPSLIVRIETQARELQQATSQILGEIVSDCLSATASVIIAFYFSWKLTLVLLATLPISLVVMAVVTNPMQPAIQAQKLHLSSASRLAAASVSAIDLVKTFNGFDHEVWQYMQTMTKVTASYLVQARSNAIQMGYVNFWIVALFVLGFWYGAVLVDQGLDPGNVLTTFYATLEAFQAIEAFLPNWMVVEKGMDAGLALQTIVVFSGAGGDRKITQRVIMAGSNKPLRCAGAVELRGVSFAYPSNPSKTVLHKSSFYFPPGKMAFLVGRSGSGKSTIGNLLVDFYKPLSGSISIDGQPVQTLDQTWLRTNVTLIQQSSVLFRDTLLANVALGLPLTAGAASRDRVTAACDAALLQSTIANLPQGLDTPVGPAGVDLSGGQKQRVTLARARLRDPPVLILDEVTSGLDETSKSLVMEALREWRKGKTTIVITHDVSQVLPDDFVYVLDRGYLVQSGLRKELMDMSSGLFASLVAASGRQDYASVLPVASSSSSRRNQKISGGQDTTTTTAKSGHFSNFVRQSVQRTDHTVFKRTSLHSPMTAYPSSLMQARQRWNFSPTAAGPNNNYPESPHETSSQMTQMTQMTQRGSESESLVGGDRAETRQQGRRQSLTMRPPRKESIDLMQAVGATAQASRMGAVDRTRVRRPDGLSTGSANTKRQLAPGVAMSTSKLSPPPPPREPTLTEIVRTVWPQLPPKERVVFVLGLVMSLVVAGANPAFSYCFAQLLGALWSEGDRLGHGRKWALVLVAAATVDGGGTYLNRYLMERAGQAWVNALRVEALKRILRQPREWFGDGRNSPERVAECLDRNAEEMRSIVGRFLPVMVTVAAMATASVAWAASISWKLTLVALAPGPVVLACIRAFAAVSTRRESACNAGAADTSAVLAETFANIRTVRALTLEPVFAAKYRLSAAKTYRLGVKRAAHASPLFGLYQSTNLFLVSLVFYYGTVLLAARRELDVPSVLQVINLLLFCMGTASMLLGSLPQISAAQATAVRVLAYVALPYDGPSPHESGGSNTRTKPDTDADTGSENRARTLVVTAPLPVRMQRLVFAYPNQPTEMVLRGVDLQIDAGTCTAIVGPSGSGKSTVASLLLGLYPPTTAESYQNPNPNPNPSTGGTGTKNPSLPPPLTFAGVSSADVDMRALRAAIGFVPQTPFLFPDTIGENILYGVPEESPLRTSATIQDAARAAGVHEYIASLPAGYTTRVGDGGLTLSGGQAQRINIARALVRRPLLLVMDEPTSALDAEGAEAVRKTIQGLVSTGRDRGGGGIDGSREGYGAAMAMVVVTHSREMMRAADRIVMLQDGHVVETGTYHDLMGRGGKFAQLLGGGRWVEAKSKDGGEEKKKIETLTGFGDVEWKEKEGL